jgi:hypothetical protein
MITLSLLKYLEDNDFGEIDKDLFFEKLTLDKKGLYISDIGDALVRGRRRSQSFEIYSRGTSDVDGYKRAQAVADFLYGKIGQAISLPAVPPISDKSYSCVRVMSISNLANTGMDDGGRIIYAITVQVDY